jgi:cytochrome c2
MKSHIVFGALAASLTLVCAKPAFAQADPVAGQTVFNQKCTNCHTVTADPGQAPKGPNLIGVIGRTAGTAPGWDFSPALKASGLVLTEENLNKWLLDPEALVPGTKMTVKVPSKFEREDLIAFIKGLNANPK